MCRPSGAVWMTPNWLEIDFGMRMPATVTPAPLAMCAWIICIGSMRYTWSAPNTTT